MRIEDPRRKYPPPAPTVARPVTGDPLPRVLFLALIVLVAAMAFLGPAFRVIPSSPGPATFKQALAEIRRLERENVTLKSRARP